MNKKEEKTLRFLMEKLNYDEYQINDKIYEIDLLNGCISLSAKDVLEFKPEELKKIMSVCWHDGELRCDCIGISDFKVENLDGDNINISWSDSNGDPHVNDITLDTKINNTGDDDWSYGLYIKNKNN